MSTRNSRGKEIKDMKPEPVAEKPVSEVPAKFGENDVKTTNYMDDADYHRVADFLEVTYDERKDVKLAEKMAYLYDWAKTETGSEDRIKRLEAIKGLQKRLGISQTGKETIKKLFQYTRLDQDRKRIEAEMGLLTSNKPDSIV